MLFSCFILIFGTCLCLMKNVQSETSKQQDETQGALLRGLASWDMSSAEQTLDVLTNLTTVQQQILEHQREQLRRSRTRNRKEDDRELARSEQLAEEQRLLKEIRQKVARKFKDQNTAGHQDVTTGTTDAPAIPPKDCADIYLKGERTSGLYNVWPVWNRESVSFLVYCDMDTDGGGWTVIHRWTRDGLSQDYFQATKSAYRSGFGDLTRSFWLGNYRISSLTSQGLYELRLEFLKGKEKSVSKYSSFRVDNNENILTIQGYDSTGTGGDVMRDHNGGIFNVEVWARCGQPVSLRGGWWTTNSSCSLDRGLVVGAGPTPIQGTSSALEMKIRPANFKQMKEAL